MKYATWKRHTLVMIAMVAFIHAEQAHESAISNPTKRGTIPTTNNNQGNDASSYSRSQRRRRPLADDNHDQANEEDETDHDDEHSINTEIPNKTPPPPSDLSGSSEWDYVWNNTRPSDDIMIRSSSSLPPRSAIQQIQHVSSSSKHFSARNNTGRDSAYPSSLHRHRHRHGSSLLVLFLLPWLQFLRNVVRTLADDWNFKGFGWAFYKSMLIREACGVALRIPLSLNFASWDRHSTRLPYFSGSVGLYYPWLTSFTLSCSMNVQVIRNVLEMLVSQLRDGLVFTLATIVRTVTICVSSLFYPLTQFWIVPEWKNRNRLAAPKEGTVLSTSSSTTATDGSTSPTRSTSRTSEQRIGLAWSWRFSLDQGFEFRFSYTHMYLQTLLYVLETILAPRIEPLLKSWLEPQTTTLSKVIDRSLFGALSDRLRRRTAALGISTSLIHDFSKLSCNAMLSLSGFRLIRLRKQQQTTTPPPPPPVAVIAPPAPATNSDTSKRRLSTELGERDESIDEEDLDSSFSPESSIASEKRELQSAALAMTDTESTSPRIKPRTTMTTGSKVTG